MFDNCETFAYEESNKTKEKNEPLKLKLIILNIYSLDNHPLKFIILSAFLLIFCPHMLQVYIANV